MNTRIFVTFLLLLATLGSTTTLCAQRNRGGRTAATHQGSTPGCDIDSIVNLFDTDPMAATRLYESCYRAPEYAYYRYIFKANSLNRIGRLDSVQHYLQLAEASGSELATTHILLRCYFFAVDTNFSQLTYWIEILEERIPAEMHINQNLLRYVANHTRSVIAYMGEQYSDAYRYAEKAYHHFMLVPQEQLGSNKNLKAGIVNTLVSSAYLNNDLQKAARWAKIGIRFPDDNKVRLKGFYSIIFAEAHRMELVDTAVAYCNIIPDEILILDTNMCRDCLFTLWQVHHSRLQDFNRRINKLHPQLKHPYIIGFRAAIDSGNRDEAIGYIESVISNRVALDSTSLGVLIYSIRDEGFTPTEICSLYERLTAIPGTTSDNALLSIYYYLKAGILGVQGNLTESCRYLRMAAEMGNPEAITAARQSCN